MLFTSNVFVNVTIGIGDDIQSSNASALADSCGFISCFIYLWLCLLSDAEFGEDGVEDVVGGDVAGDLA